MRERCEGGSSIDQTPSCGHCDSSSASLTQLAQRFPRSKLGIIVLCVLLSATSISASPLLQLQPVLRTLARGACFRVACDMSGGLPIDHWKTRNVRQMNETALQSLTAIYKYQGGVGGYWAGLPAKVVEGSICGALFMAGREGTMTALARVGFVGAGAGVVAGATGGLAQCLVLAPTTMLVTIAATTGSNNVDIFKDVLAGRRSVKGLYEGWEALAGREVTNWASRQGITDLVRNSLTRGGIKGGIPLEIGSGVLGGVLACWNNPFEVARIKKQAVAANRGQPPTGEAPELSSWRTMHLLVQEQGPQALAAGLIPRCALSAWITCFMVVAPRLIP